MSVDTLRTGGGARRREDAEPRALPSPFLPAAQVWPHLVNVVAGVWLASATITFSPQPPTLLASDIVSGLLIVVLSGLACLRRFPWAAWLVGAVGLWLLAAPLVFWAPTAVAFGNDTLIGTLTITFALLVPGTQGTRDLPGPDSPPGWSYNPSTWPQRSGIIALAFVQFFIARYMAAHQLGHIPHAWDPFFGDGTYRVLNSDVSKSFPVSDAGLGALSYLIEALTGLLGGTRRWRTMPWVVLLFGVLIVPVGVVSIVLVVLQPLAVGAWCSLCLTTAILTVFMISPAVDEVVATCEFLMRARRDGQPLWHTFWFGGTDDKSAGEELPKEQQTLFHQLGDGLEINAIPWNLAVCAALGLWLMVSPAILGSTGAAAANEQITGALILTFAVIGFGESARAARWINIPLGLWMLLAPWILTGATPTARWSDILIGVAVLLLTWRRGSVKSRFGSWDRWIV